MEAGDPCDILTGTIAGTGPLRVQLDQKTVLSQSQLWVPRHLTDYSQLMVIPEVGEVMVEVKNALKTGEKVLLIQKRGAQNYLIADRW